jgi:hypothetical protein
VADFFGHLLKVPFTDKPRTIHVIEPLYITAAGRVTQSSNADSVEFSTMGLGVAAGTVGLTIVPISAANQGLVVKAFTGQTAKLVEIQNSSGTVKLSIDDAGSLIIAGALDHDGTTAGFFGATPATQPTDVGAMTLTTGTPDNTLVDVTGTGDDTVINANFADVGSQLNDLRTRLRNLGLMA